MLNLLKASLIIQKLSKMKTTFKYIKRQKNDIPAFRGILKVDGEYFFVPKEHNIFKDTYPVDADKPFNYRDQYGNYIYFSSERECILAILEGYDPFLATETRLKLSIKDSIVKANETLNARLDNYKKDLDDQIYFLRMWHYENKMRQQLDYLVLKKLSNGNVRLFTK